MKKYEIIVEESIKETINKLKRLENKKILFFCIGNILKGDDGVGEYIYKRLHNKRGNIQKISGGNAPLNYIGKIQQFSPEIVIIIDCIDSKNLPGYVIFTSLNSIYSLPVDTHSGLLKEFINTLTFDNEWYILGIQPQSLHGVEKISHIVRNTADKIIEFINKEL